MSKAFAFEIFQRVLLPADDLLGKDVQAVIVDRREFAGREPQYGVQYLAVGTMPSTGELPIGVGSYPETKLKAAQPETGSVTVSVDVDQTRLDEALGKARELKTLVTQASVNPRRKAKRNARKRR
jgi:hypothetical protein